MSVGKPLYRLHCLAMATLATLAILAGGRDAGAGDAEKGRAKAVLCIACHGATGIGARPEIPNLGGQNQAYLITQMKALRRSGQDQVPSSAPGLRADVVMGHQAAAMTDADIDDLVAYYSSRSCMSTKAKPTGRQHPVMSRQADLISEPDIGALAHYFSSRTCE